MQEILAVVHVHECCELGIVMAWAACWWAPMSPRRVDGLRFSIMTGCRHDRDTSTVSPTVLECVCLVLRGSALNQDPAALSGFAVAVLLIVCD